MNAKQRMILAMIFFGTISLFVKNIPISSGEIALFRAVIATIVIFIYQCISGNRLRLSSIRRDLPALFVSGAMIGFNWILLFQAYRYTTVSIATLSYYFAPVIVMAVSPLLFKESLTPKQLICFLMATVGLVLIIGVNGIGKAGSNITGIGFGISAAVLYASIILTNKSIKNVTGIDRTLIQFVAAILVLIPYVWVTSGIHVQSLPLSGLLSLAVLGVVHTGICYCLYFSSIKELRGQEVSILSYIDPFVAILVSVLVLGEPLLPMQILGGIMILGFTLWNEVKFDLFRKKEGA